MEIQGIIFDLDGTLANTEHLHMEAWFQVLAQYGLHFDEKWFEQWIGLSDGVLAASAVKTYHINTTVPALQEQKRTAYHRIARERAELFPGVEEGLVSIATHCKLAIATSSSKNDAAAVFSNTQVNRFFEAIVTSDDVTQLKPAPDCYLLAASHLGLPPKNGVAVEDSIAGVRAAKTAGIYTLAVGNSHPYEQLAEANLFFDSTTEAMTWICQELGAQKL